MIDVQIALRNLLRNWRRSLTTTLAIVIGVLALLLFGGFTNAIMATLETGIVGSTGHIHVQRQGFARYGFGNPAQYSIENTNEVIAVMNSDPLVASHLRVVTPLLLFNGLAGRYDAGSSHMMSGEGVEVSGQQALRTWDAYGLTHAVGGRFTLPDSPDNAALVGVGLGRMLGLCDALGIDECPAEPASALPADAAPIPDDISALAQTEARTPGAGEAKIDLLTSQPNGAPNVVSAQVMRAENQGLSALDSTYVAVHLDLARKLVFGSDAAEQSTLLIAQLDSTRNMAIVKDRLNTVIAEKGWPLVAVDFQQFFAEYHQVQRMFQTIFGFIAILMGVIVLFTVANTMSAAVLERTAEIGTIRALGVRPRGVRRLFLIEGSLLGLFGVAVGIALALLCAWAVNHSGLTWVPPNRVARVPLLVSLAGDWRLIVGASSTLLVVAMLSAWVPARRGSRRSIVEALRYA
ncbi:ABC transporter permease [Tahibacter amnicola]|uniref:FtsX-like permease family protein n=1 Tax=Tahibacter amnicola TaxID=2976241 RepID=A0ABY6B9I2_9GAMM|nr:FtsX-like permease family protein [Tahibacter amnicola]UXI66196.1 FtsX-like permease family protein [Tahibacter amnicola]